MPEVHRKGLLHLIRLPMLTPLPWAVVVGYLLVFLILDWASFIRPLQGLNITPWNPQPALAVALLMASRRLWWVVITGLLAAEMLVRGLHGDLMVVTLAAAALTCSYLAMAAALERRLGDGWRISSGRDVVWFLVIIALGALLSGAVYVGTYAAGGVLPTGPLWAALARYWVGDAVGMTVEATALEQLVRYGSGQPRILHMLGDQAFWLDTDGRIDAGDVNQALVAAAADFTRKYVGPQILAELRSGDYRSILKKICDQDPLLASFSKAEVAAGLSEQERKKLDNFLQRMKQLNVLRQGQGKGEWVFNTPMVRTAMFLFVQGSA